MKSLILGLLLIASTASAQTMMYSYPRAVAGGGASSPTTPGGTVTGANQYRSASGTFAGDDLVINDGAGGLGLVRISASDTISASMFTATGPGTAASVQVGFSSGTKGFYSCAGSRLCTSAGNSLTWTFANTYNTSNRPLGVRGDGGGDFTPNATLDISGTLKIGPCSTAQACGTNDAGNLCRVVRTNTLYQCNGAGSFAPMLYGTPISNTGLN